jgi:hypothetical protein
MQFRCKAFSIHLIASASVLTLILAGLYLGWYRWPGWYLSDVSTVVAVMIGVDVVLGPTLTFIIANNNKPRRELTRDLAVIVVVQLCALSYGSTSLWHGRPIYYAYSEGFLQLVQAYDISADEMRLGREQNPSLAPSWYSLPRWVWAPLPEDNDTQQKILASAVTGGDDVISLPRYYKRWQDGASSLKSQLKKVDELRYFSKRDKDVLKKKMKEAGFADDQPDTMVFTGRSAPLLAVFDAKNLSIAALFKVK